jgi:hypothetical protein
LESGCAYVLGNQIGPLGKPECKENQSQTMIMKPRLWGVNLTEIQSKPMVSTVSAFRKPTSQLAAAPTASGQPDRNAMKTNGFDRLCLPQAHVATRRGANRQRSI